MKRKYTGKEHQYMTSLDSHPRTRHHYIEPLILCLLIFLIYSNTFQAPFILDDLNSIVDNPHIRSVLPLKRAMDAPDQSTVAGRPAIALSLAANYAISQLQPWSYHLVNILIHCFAALTLLGILRRIFLRPGTVNKTSFLGTLVRWGAFSAALIWSVHPLHTETITYVSTRTESLAGMFILISVYCLLRGNTSPFKRYWQSLSVLSCVMAMGSKETAAALPLLLVLFDRVFLSQGWRNTFRRNGWFHLSTGATWIFLIYLVTQGPRSATVGLYFTDMTPLDYLRTQSNVIFHYLHLSIWPHPLVLDYTGWPVAHMFTSEILLKLAVLGGLFLFFANLVLRGSPAGYAGIWFFFILAPSSSIIAIVTEIAAERRMYLPLISVIVLVISGFDWLYRRVFDSIKEKKTRQSSSHRKRVIFAIIPLTIIAGILSYLTFQRNAVYGSDLSIWRDTVRKRPDNPRAHANLGMAYLRSGNDSEAIIHFQKALSLDPKAKSLLSGTAAVAFTPETLSESSVKSLENWALLYLEHGNVTEAVRFLELCVQARPEDAVSRVNLGKAYMIQGNMQQAMRILESAIQLDPDHGLARSHYARLLADDGQVDRALTEINRAVQLEPYHPDVLHSAGLICLTAGKWYDAERYFRSETEQLSSERSLAGTAAALLHAGKTDAANSLLDKIARNTSSEQALIGTSWHFFTSLDRETAVNLLAVAAEILFPKSPDIRLSRGRMLAAMGRDPEALDEYKIALILKPGWGEAGNSLAFLLATADNPDIRDSETALKMAEDLSRAAGNRHPVLLGTLAVAQASVGERDQARETMTRAIELARQMNNPALADELKTQLEQINNGWPEPAGNKH
ncbi:tetratricopeptide repeat protein [bacterium]|nr:tetratricopeptide repeat protein [candidate division CSSED10-310 bacterium]